MKLLLYKVKIAILLPLVFASCSDLLDKYPHNSVGEEDAIESVHDANTALVGIYAEVMSGYWGQDAILLGDIMTDACYPTKNFTGYNRFQSFNFSSSDSEVRTLWLSLYSVINNANLIINKIDGVSGGTPKEKNEIKGQTLALRAIAYMELTKWFSPAFSIDSTGLGVPIILSRDNEARPLRSSLIDTYNQVEADLLAAEKLLENKKGVGEQDVKYISLWSVKSLLARFYLYRASYEKAAGYASQVISSNKFLLCTSTESLKSMLRDDKGSELIFEVAYTKTSYGRNLNAPYYDKSINPPKVNYIPSMRLTKLYQTFGPANSAKFGEEDIRFRDGSFFIKGTANGRFEGRFCYKYPGNPALKDNANMPKIIRLPELYLIRAEAYSYLGKDADALADYNTLRKTRIESYVNETSLKGQALKDEIFNERMRELCFEGFYWFDLKRAGKGFAKSPAEEELAYIDVSGAHVSVAANSHRWVLPIPLDELNGNPNIQKNPGY